MRKVNLLLVSTVLLVSGCSQLEADIETPMDEVSQERALEVLDWDENFEYSSDWEVLDSDKNVLVSKNFTEREAVGFELQSEEDIGRIVKEYDTRISMSNDGFEPCFEDLDELQGGDVQLGDHEFSLCFIAPEGIISFVYSIDHPETGETIYFKARGLRPEEEIKKSTEEVLSTLQF